ncbi:type B DNA-directed DNA polymerase [uncultured Methanoregula sp.]|uniref:type B DNA-directed DNA polymerase n=1 Tax=uncultured Methanoregula sp. TaxID=1005933 RepID=UPI002AAC22B6|nr:type B DNA-directed DNA polymerase [uncultured Methanoregula sp.]
MWILDSVPRGGIDLWCKEGSVRLIHHEYDPPFYLYLQDPDAHHGMITALEEQFRAEPCTFRTIFGEFDGYKVFAGRDVAEAIERQTLYAAQLFNVDIRKDQRFMAENGIVPCCDDLEARFSPDISHNLSRMEIRIRGDPGRDCACTEIELVHERTERLAGPEREVLSDLFALIAACDPDVILMPHADRRMPYLQARAREYGLTMTMSRSGKYRTIGSRSYWSYGRVEYKDAALIPDGRILIDTEQSFVYRESGLSGVLLAARLSGISPGLVSRLTPGTLISGYETYEAIRRGIAVPFRKSDAESVRKFALLRGADRGGMMFQPKAGVFENVDEIDFTSMYPSIIVKANLSPETIRHRERPGFLPAALEPLLELRKKTKVRKRSDPSVAGLDAILKWMLVTCFGYTGYKNAKFGRIEVHEAITGRSREILLQTKEIAEEMGFTVLHGIVDCLWVQGPAVMALQERIDRETGLPVEIGHFDWLVFLPLSDGFGAYNRYYGRPPDGSVKVRGIAARRHDTPGYIRRMQGDMLAVMARAETIAELDERWDEVRCLYRTAAAQLPAAPVHEMAISRRISRLTYAHRCIEGAAVAAYRQNGADVAPGMKIQYVVRDACAYRVEPVWSAETFDIAYYRELLERAWTEIAYAFRKGREDRGLRV